MTAHGGAREWRGAGGPAASAGPDDQSAAVPSEERHEGCLETPIRVAVSSAC